MMQPCLIAEIGCNHCGRMELARELVETAAQFCKTPFVKFQKRNPREVLTEREFSLPHPNPMHSYGDSYGEHREFLEFSLDQHRELMAHCAACGVGYSCSVWDLSSAREIAGLGPAFIKVPSACNTHFEMARLLCDEFSGELHVALGMTSAVEIDEIVSFYEARGRARDVVLYHCTSGYPVSFDELNLLEIERLRSLYSGTVKAFGFSGHHLGIAADIAAYTLGASFIERHFTLDRTMKGTDHAASLEPDGMRRLWRDLQAVHRTLRHKDKEILDVEEPQRKKLKWNRNQ